MRRGGFYKRFPKDFLDGCAGLTLEAHGLYNIVVDEIYINGGPVEIDPKALGRRACSNVRVIRRLLNELVDLGKLYLTDDGRFGNVRADKEMGLSEPDRAPDLFHATVAKTTSLAKDSPKIRERFGKHEPKSAQSLVDSVENTPTNSTEPRVPARAGGETPETLETPDLLTNPERVCSQDERARATPPVEKSDSDRKFALFWQAYPHRVGRARAKEAFPVALNAAGSLSALIDGARRYEREKPPERQWLNPATWLNEQRWLDEPALRVVSGHRSTGPPAASFEAELDKYLKKG
jgi:uncharacterized protein YdaU (DUF1376 family)